MTSRVAVSTLVGLNKSFRKRGGGRTPSRLLTARKAAMALGRTVDKQLTTLFELWANTRGDPVAMLRYIREEAVDHVRHIYNYLNSNGLVITRTQTNADNGGLGARIDLICTKAGSAREIIIEIKSVSKSMAEYLTQLAANRDAKERHAAYVAQAKIYAILHAKNADKGKFIHDLEAHRVNNLPISIVLVAGFDRAQAWMAYPSNTSLSHWGLSAVV